MYVCMYLCIYVTIYVSMYLSSIYLSIYLSIFLSSISLYICYLSSVSLFIMCTLCMHVCVRLYACHRLHVEVRGRLTGDSSYADLSCGLNFCHQAWWQWPSPTKPSHLVPPPILKSFPFETGSHFVARVASPL